MSIHNLRECQSPGELRRIAPHCAPDQPAAPQPVPSPDAMRRRLAPGPRARDVVERTRQEIADVLSGRDRHRLVVVMGPCSIHDPSVALEYAARLATAANAHREDLIVVMRSYFEKPRSRGGWKGLVNDPTLDGSCDLARGLELAREILVAIGELGLPCASELLDPLVAPYLEDLLSWASIGARTVESQPHRELASGLSLPVGVKNGLDGDVLPAVNALHAIAQPHRRLALLADGSVAAVQTHGNPNAHLVLRGGASGPNYSEQHVEAAAGATLRKGLARPVWVDCSHGNSGKDHRLQAHACRAVLEQVRAGRNAIGGLLIESNLCEGQQTWQAGQAGPRGVSITDACIGWGESEWLLGEIAAAVRTQRRSMGCHMTPR
jgi:3-deoxy-7-phosphoheptulonate synthase